LSVPDCIVLLVARESRKRAAILLCRAKPKLAKRRPIVPALYDFASAAIGLRIDVEFFTH
jgi:hypothetical protein